MYDIKRVIDKIKQIANLKSNADLARLLNISYNTLNTWIKRNSIPFNVITCVSQEFNISLNWLFLNVGAMYLQENNDTTNINQTNHPLLNFQSEFKKLEQLATMGKGLENLKIKLDNLKEELKKDI